jgi:hypothetical protein
MLYKNISHLSFDVFFPALQSSWKIFDCKFTTCIPVLKIKKKHLLEASFMIYYT